MARPKVHEDSTTLSVRLPRQLKTDLAALAAKKQTTVNALVVQGLTGLCGTEPQQHFRERLVAVGESIRSAEPSANRDTQRETCPHRYRAQRGGKSVCPACGDER